MSLDNPEDGQGGSSVTKGKFVIMTNEVSNVTTSSTTTFNFPNGTQDTGAKSPAVIPFDGTVKKIFINTQDHLALGSSAITLFRRPVAGGITQLTTYPFNQASPGVEEIDADDAVFKGDGLGFFFGTGALNTFSVTISIEYDLV